MTVARALLLAVLIAAVAGAALQSVRHVRADEAARRSLAARMAAIVPGRAQDRRPCADLLAKRPLILLALGQSNAGNHGTAGDDKAIDLIDESGCLEARDPLPGGTGNGGSIWSRLPAALQARGLARPVLLSVLAVDATTIADWTEANSPLAVRLGQRLSALRAQGAMPAAVLWQQGEADAMQGTSEDAYLEGLQALDRLLRAGNTFAPILLAQSTVCRSMPSAAIQRAQKRAIAGSDRFRAGPNTDSLRFELDRRDGCHFAAEALTAAAALWAAPILLLAHGP